jgi:glycosyltransferase involved in cell wall biosynthesis
MFYGENHPKPLETGWFFGTGPLRSWEKTAILNRIFLALQVRAEAGVTMSQPLQRNDADLSVDIVIPVLNEAHVLRKSVETALNAFRSSLRYRWQLVIVDNGSTDGTQAVAEALTAQYSEVKFIHLVQRGRGRALRNAWLQGKADIVCYMDVDLSTSLVHVPQLLGAIAHEGYDLATGSRLMRESRTTRSFKREVVSQIYNLLIKALLFTKFSDAQCGFKAVSRRAVEAIVPKIENQSWFFDTEMLVLAEKSGYRIKDIPVVWVEDDDSRVKIVQTGWEDVKGLVRLRRYLWSRRMAGAPITNADQRRS